MPLYTRRDLEKKKKKEKKNYQYSVILEVYGMEEG